MDHATTTPPTDLDDVDDGSPSGEPDAPLEEHPADGEMPSDVNVQAERQEPLGH